VTLTSRRALATKNLLLSSALQLFSRRWYETVSVAEICRHARLSNGIFYRYFRSKEQLMRELLEGFLQALRESLQELPGRSVAERLRAFVARVIETETSARELLCVFREGQYRFPEYEGSLRSLYTESLARVYGRNLNEAEYVYLAGSLRFMISRSLSGRLALDAELITSMLLGGIFERPMGEPGRVFRSGVQPPPAEPAESSRERIMAAGSRLFGEKGYFNVNVFEIARAAGFSVGTFYVHFGSKERFLSELVRLIGHRTRQFISSNLDSSLNRLERELQGMYLFLSYFRHDRHYYEIVREAEFVVDAEARSYYDRFEEGYMRNLEQIRWPDRRLVANALMGIAHYLGIEVLYCETIAEAQNVLVSLGRCLYAGIRD
jgi:AcrR family transcriptional regulator